MLLSLTALAWGCGRSDFTSALLRIVRDAPIETACEGSCDRLMLDPRLFSRRPGYYPAESLSVIRQLARVGDSVSIEGLRIVFQPSPTDSLPERGSVVQAYLLARLDTGYRVALEFAGRNASFSIAGRVDSLDRGWVGRFESHSIH